MCNGLFTHPYGICCSVCVKVVLNLLGFNDTLLSTLHVSFFMYLEVIRMYGYPNLAWGTVAFPIKDMQCAGAGYTIEDLMQQLCSRGISYYFAAITTRTDQMARIMQECYANNVNVEFKARL